MKVVIASRIFSPEISAASGILRIWAEEFRDAGWSVEVLTAKPPKGLPTSDPEGIGISRATVIRDRQQYVRGYLSYLSFDLPLFFRLLFRRRPDIYVVEPPPTTVAVVRLIAAVKRTPYAVRAADYWSEAAELATNSRFVLWALRRMEAWGLSGATVLFAAHEPLIARFRAAGISTRAIPIGFGADTKDFQYHGEEPAKPPVFLYAGTYSEWHAAGIFVNAMPKVLHKHPGARLVYYGNGEDRDELRRLASELGVENSVEFNGPIPPAELSKHLAKATVSVASLAPVAANEYALATKVYSSLAAGCPVIFAGVGPTRDFLSDSEHQTAGVAVEYDIGKVEKAMISAAAHPLDPAERSRLADWSAKRFSLKSIARQVVEECQRITQK